MAWRPVCDGAFSLLRWWDAAFRPSGMRPSCEYAKRRVPLRAQPLPFQPYPPTRTPPTPPHTDGVRQAALPRPQEHRPQDAGTMPSPSSRPHPPSGDAAALDAYCGGGPRDGRPRRGAYARGVRAEGARNSARVRGPGPLGPDALRRSSEFVRAPRAARARPDGVAPAGPTDRQHAEFSAAGPYNPCTFHQNHSPTDRQAPCLP